MRFVYNICIPQQINHGSIQASRHACLTFSSVILLSLFHTAVSFKSPGANIHWIDSVGSIFDVIKIREDFEPDGSRFVSTNHAIS